MTPVYNVIVKWDASRGRGALFMHDVHRAGVFAVALRQDGLTTDVNEGGQREMEEQFDAICLDVGSRYGWLAVRDRLMLRPQESCRWQGSPAEWAARSAAPGSVHWVELLVSLRRKNIELGLPEGTLPQL